MPTVFTEIKNIRARQGIWIVIRKGFEWLA